MTPGPRPVTTNLESASLWRTPHALVFSNDHLSSRGYLTDPAPKHAQAAEILHRHLSPDHDVDWSLLHDWLYRAGARRLFRITQKQLPDSDPVPACVRTYAGAPNGVVLSATHDRTRRRLRSRHVPVIGPLAAPVALPRIDPLILLVHDPVPGDRLVDQIGRQGIVRLTTPPAACILICTRGTSGAESPEATSGRLPGAVPPA